MKEKVMNGLEKFSKAMLSPLSYISAAGLDRKSTRLNSSHNNQSRMPSSA